MSLYGDSLTKHRSFRWPRTVFTRLATRIVSHSKDLLLSNERVVLLVRNLAYWMMVGANCIIRGIGIFQFLLCLSGLLCQLHINGIVVSLPLGVCAEMSPYLLVSLAG